MHSFENILSLYRRLNRWGVEGVFGTVFLRMSKFLQK